MTQESVNYSDAPIQQLDDANRAKGLLPEPLAIIG